MSKRPKPKTAEGQRFAAAMGEPNPGPRPQRKTWLAIAVREPCDCGCGRPRCVSLESFGVVNLQSREAVEAVIAEIRAAASEVWGSAC